MTSLGFVYHKKYELQWTQMSHIVIAQFHAYINRPCISRYLNCRRDMLDTILFDPWNGYLRQQSSQAVVNLFTEAW